MQHRSGFTLVELSIVLVIVGLIIGGIVVGQDLIQAARVRAQIGQIEQYNSAVNTFRSKYNALPGDMLPADAGTFGLYDNDPYSGGGNGNGLIEGTGSPSIEGPHGETLIFWRHLADANLIEFSGDVFETLGAGPFFGDSIVSHWLPPAKLGRQNYLTVGTANGFNYFAVVGITKVQLLLISYLGLSPNITPIEAYDIDLKTDDGLPETGLIQARSAVGTGGGFLQDLSTGNEPTVAATPTPGNCAVGTATNASNTYNLDVSNGGSVPACVLRFRFN